MNGREIILQELIENVDKMLEIIEDQQDIEPGFALVRDLADELRQEIRLLEE